MFRPELQSWFRFRQNRKAVERAAQDLGIVHEVKVFVREYKHGLGAYSGFRDGSHRIGIDWRMPHRAASAVIWHELTHVAQIERLGGAEAFYAQRERERVAAGLSPEDEYRAERRAYRQMPLEREAHESERRHRDVLLTRPYRRALPRLIERGITRPFGIVT